MFEKLKQEICKYYGTEKVEFKEVTSGRTNTNFFIQVWTEEYFLRTNITKVVDSEFWGKLEKEKMIYEALKWKWVTAEILHYFDDTNGLKFIIMEKIQWHSPLRFHDDQRSILLLLQDLKNIDLKEFHFLKHFDIFSDFKKIIDERIQHVCISELNTILWELTHYLYKTDWNFEEESSLCHNDFRSDNIIISWNKAQIIDLESLVISDTYIDPVEYYVGWIFWDNFVDLKDFDFKVYTEYMNSFWYTNPEKQKYIYILKFCSNFAWLSSHISQEANPLEIYQNTLKRNIQQYYKNIRELIN